MAKEERIRSVKGIQDNSEDVITLRGLANQKNLYESDLSKPYYRKSTTNLYTQKEHPLFNDETLIKKSFSFSGTPRESESQKQPLQVPKKSNRSSHRIEPEIDMKTVYKSMAEFESSLLKRAQLAGGKKRQSVHVTSNESRQRNTAADLTLLGTDLESRNLIRLNNLLSSNILLSDSSANSGLPKKNSLIPRRKIRNNITLNREPLLKTSTNPKQPKSKVRALRKVVLKKPSNPDRASKITSESRLPASSSRIIQKMPSKNSTSVEQTSRASTDVASTRNKSRSVQKVPSKNITNVDPASKASVELAKLRATQTQSKSRNDQESEKSVINQSSITRTSRPPVKKSTSKQSNESEKRNLSKTLPIRARSRSKSINTSTRRHSEANIPIEQLANDESPTHVQDNNDPSTEPVNVQQLNQIDSNTIPNSEEPTTTNTSQTTSIPDEQECTVAPANENQANLPTNDHVENVPSVISNHEDEHFTSPSERILNPDGDVRQSSPETRTQPIPIDPNSAYAAKHDLEAWLRNSAAQSDTSRPIKTSRVHPYPKFPVIRPCDKDLTSDPEDCKKKLEQKLERMHKLKQAYYSDPEDNIPFINLAYTKEGIFVDEPIENAFVYDDDFLKDENSENYSRLSSGTRGNPSESVIFSSPRLKLRHEEASASLTSNE